MARRRREKESSDSLNLPEKRCHFFKIILKANIRDGRLRIPPKFVRKFRKELSDITVLKVPSGKVWSIGLSKAEGNVWFEKGWQEFVQYYSICENHFLVFRYDGNSSFYVCIFDTTASEIEYPCDNVDCEENNPKGGCQIVKENDGQDLVEIYSSSPTRKSMIEAHRDFLTSCGQLKADRNGLWLKQEEENLQVAQTDVHTKGSVTKRRPIMIQERERVLQEAKEFKSKNPFSIIEMKPSYVSSRSCYLNLPGCFTKRFLTETPQRVTLQGPNGKSWHVHFCTVRGGKKTRIHKGWNVFAEENSLEEGDICIFELVRKSSIVLKVLIFRLNEDVPPHGS